MLGHRGNRLDPQRVQLVDLVRKPRVSSPVLASLRGARGNFGAEGLVLRVCQFVVGLVFDLAVVLSILRSPILQYEASDLLL